MTDIAPRADHDAPRSTAPNTSGKDAASPPAPPSAPPPVDQIFADPVPRATDFVFDARTANVFDDMVDRSVPFYGELQRMIGELAADFAVPGSSLYDLGCSTGTSLALLHPLVHPDVRFVGVDNSPQMLDKARQKLAVRTSGRSLELRQADLHDLQGIDNASVAILMLTLQFVRPLHRERLVRTICEGTRDQGCLILVEKLTESDTLFNRLFIGYYHEMKRRHGYSELEISQKREALENVLIPYRLEENRDLLLNAGYSKFQVFFRWYNFCGMIAVK